jgi:signal transduction histidine kinase
MEEMLALLGRDAPLVLAVDDILQNLQVLGAILMDEGYEVSIAQSGIEALEALEHDTPDLILLDVMMPNMTGFEVCEKIKQNPTLAAIPIIFLTAKSEIEDIVRGFKLGGVDYITKPFNKDELLVRINTHLNLKFARDLIIKQNTRLEQLNLEKNEFLGIAAHDLKNPLTAIKGLSEVLADPNSGLDKDEILDFSKMILHSSEFMFQIIIDLLDINAIEEGKINFNIEEIDAFELLKLVSNKFRMRAEDKRIKLNLIPNNDTLHAFADPGRCQQILDNLVSNAIKFSPFDRNIWIAASKTVDEKYIKIEVKDEGPGISEDDMKKLFGKFTRLSARPTNNENSTGLGLSIVKRLVEEMRGRIYCESKLGEGAKFVLELPTEP